MLLLFVYCLLNKSKTGCSFFWYFPFYDGSTVLLSKSNVNSFILNHNDQKFDIFVYQFLIMFLCCSALFFLFLVI